MVDLTNENRYSLARKMSVFITKLSRKYKLTDNNGDFHVFIKFEKHLADRMLDREFPVEEFQKITTRICRNHVCEMIYLGEVYGQKRINVYGDDDYMIGCTVNRSEKGNFYIKLNTIYKERNSANRVRSIHVSKIYTGEAKHDCKRNETNRCAL